MVTLRVRQEGEQPHVRSYDDEIITIGKMGTNLLVLAHDEVSRRHATIERQGSSWVIIDKGSTNGTFVDDRKLDPNVPAPLRPGMKIVIGPFQIAFDDDTLATDSTDLNRTVVGTRSTAAPVDLGAELRRAYAMTGGTPEQQAQAIRAVLQDARRTLGDQRMVQEVEKELAKLGPARAAASQEAPAASQEDFYFAAHKALGTLSQRLLGRDEAFSVGSEIDRFALLLESFVRETADWVVRCAEVRQTIRESFSADTTGFQSERNPLHAARDKGDVITYLLDWSDHNKRAEDVGPVLAGLYRAFVSQHGSVLSGAQAACAELLRRLNPKTIEQQARTNAGFLVTRDINKALTSPLWRELQRVWDTLSDPGRLASEIVSPQMKQALQSTDPGRTIVDDKEQ